MARLLIGLALLAASFTANAADPFDGKWQLNLTNSMFDPGPAPKSLYGDRKSVV